MGYLKCSEATPKKPWGFNHGVRLDTGSVYVALFEVFVTSLFYSLFFIFCFLFLFEDFCDHFAFLVLFFFCFCVYVLSCVCGAVEEEDMSNQKRKGGEEKDKEEKQHEEQLEEVSPALVNQQW